MALNSFHRDGTPRVKIARNGREGLQIEVGGALLTLRLDNPHHGLSGSLAVKAPNGATWLLPFHGRGPDKPLPVEVHAIENLDHAKGDGSGH